MNSWHAVGKCSVKMIKLTDAFSWSLANGRGSWVVGNSRGSWVWVWVKVVGNKIKKKIDI